MIDNLPGDFTLLLINTAFEWKMTLRQNPGVRVRFKPFPHATTLQQKTLKTYPNKFGMKVQ